MTLIRLLLLGIFSYFVVRMVRGIGSQNKTKVNAGKQRKVKDPFENADIQDVPYTEVEDEKNNKD